MVTLSLESLVFPEVLHVLRKRVIWELWSSQGWGTCGPRERLIWPASEFSLLK